MAIFFNQATLTYNGGTVNSNVTTGEILETLNVTKTAVVEEYTTSSEITYAINMTNTGTAPVTGVTLTDDLGAYPFGTDTLIPLDYVEGSVKYFIDGVLQPSPTTTAQGGLVIGPITIPAGGVATVLYTAEANGFASPEAGGVITNTVTVTGGGQTATATESITRTDDPDITLTKALSPATVTDNGRITYTIVIENSGNSAVGPEDNVVISDTFDPRLTDLTVTLNGTALTEPEGYAYNEATGAFTTISGLISVPAATFTQDIATGLWTTTPGSVTLVVSGNVIA